MSLRRRESADATSATARRAKRVILKDGAKVLFNHGKGFSRTCWFTTLVGCLLVAESDYDMD